MTEFSESRSIHVNGGLTNGVQTLRLWLCLGSAITQSANKFDYFENWESSPDFHNYNDLNSIISPSLLKCLTSVLAGVRLILCGLISPAGVTWVLPSVTLQCWVADSHHADEHNCTSWPWQQSQCLELQTHETPWRGWRGAADVGVPWSMCLV